MNEECAHTLLRLAEGPVWWSQPMQVVRFLCWECGVAVPFKRLERTALESAPPKSAMANYLEVSRETEQASVCTCDLSLRWPTDPDCPMHGKQPETTTVSTHPPSTTASTEAPASTKDGPWMRYGRILVPAATPPEPSTEGLLREAAERLLKAAIVLLTPPSSAALEPTDAPSASSAGEVTA